MRNRQDENGDDDTGTETEGEERDAKEEPSGVDPSMLILLIQRQLLDTFATSIHSQINVFFLGSRAPTPMAIATHHTL